LVLAVRDLQQTAQAMEVILHLALSLQMAVVAVDTMLLPTEHLVVLVVVGALAQLLVALPRKEIAMVLLVMEMLVVFILSLHHLVMHLHLAVVALVLLVVRLLQQVIMAQRVEQV
jgi:hypothetical protein